MAPSGPPHREWIGLDDSGMCAASSTSPAIAIRRCQIAARSMPSNHSSTHGSELIRTSAAESSRIETAPTSCPT